MKIAMMTNNYKPFVGGVPVSIELLAKGLIAAGHEVTVFAPAVQSAFLDSDDISDTASGNVRSTAGSVNSDDPSGVCEHGTTDTRKTAFPGMTSCMTVCDGVPVFRYASLPYCFLGGAACPNPFDPRIEKEFHRGHYDIIHVHHPMLIGRTAVHLSRRYGVPLVFTYHTRYDQYLSNAGVFRAVSRPSGEERQDADSLFSSLDKRFLHLMQEKMVPLYLNLFLRNCQQVFAPTAGMKEYLTEICGFDPTRIAVLPTGIEEDCFHANKAAVKETRAKLFNERPCVTPFSSAAAPESTAASAAPAAAAPAAGCVHTKNPENIPLFLSVSRLSHEKNIPFLLRSAARFREQYRKPFRLAIIGDGPGRAEYEALRRRLHLEQEVIFPGNIPHKELAPYYAAADAFLFASKTETQGIVILEAFAGGAPVIALDASGVRDLVRDRINGLLCAEDEDAFAESMNRFLTDPMLREQLRRCALETAVDFREESVVKKAIRFYNKTIAAYEQSHTGALPAWKYAAEQEAAWESIRQKIASRTSAARP